MKKNKLLLSWCAFIILLLSFGFFVEFYEKTRSESGSVYQYRILIDDDILKTSVIPEKTPQADIKIESNSSDKEIVLYESVDNCELPKIAINGTRVFDKYSVKIDKSTSDKKIYVAVVLNESDFGNLQIFLKTLMNTKLTFIIPYYMTQLDKAVEAIISNGHEFFIQLPTQAAIPEHQNSIISPFLVNSSPEEIKSKLLKLLSTTKYCIGIANTTPTLLTKSKKDMEIIIDELAKRGLAWFDREQPNDLINSVMTERNAIYIHSAASFEKHRCAFMEETKIITSIDLFPRFVEILNKAYTIYPVSASWKP